MTEGMHNDDVGAGKAAEEARTRRAFIGRCGKYAVATAPAVTLMLSAANKPALARNRYGGGRRGRGGGGEGGGEGGRGRGRRGRGGGGGWGGWGGLFD